MSAFSIAALVMVIVGVVFGVIDGGWRNPLFWFVLAFAVIYIVGPMAGHIR